MSPSNLTAVYNNNPTLQSMYSLPDYLALFGQDSSSTPQLATAYVDPTTSTTSAPASTGIPSIINQNLNQGGGEGDGNNTIGGKDYGYNSSFAQDDKVQGPQTKEEIEGFLNDIGEGTIDDDDLTAGLSFKEGLYSLQNTFKNLPTPLNLARKGIKAFNDYQEKKEAERQKKEAERQQEIEKEKKAAEVRQAIADAEAIERIRQQYAAQGRDYGQGGASQETQDSYEGSDGSYSGQGEASDWGGGEKDGGYIDGSNRRKKIIRSYFNGGIVSLRRR